MAKIIADQAIARNTEKLRVALTVDCSNPRHAAQNAIGRGANVRATDSEGRPFLQLAIEKGMVETVRFMISRDADTNAVGPDGRCMFQVMLEAKHSHRESLAKVLIGVEPIIFMQRRRMDARCYALRVIME